MRTGLPLFSAVAVTLAVAACGTADVAQDGARDGAAADSPGCAQEVLPIELDPAFTPYDRRLTRSLAVGEPVLHPIDPADGKAEAAWASMVEGDTVTLVYGGDRSVREPWQVLRSGGYLVSEWPGTPGHSLARALADDQAAAGELPQVALVPVGQYDAAVSWADPDAHGQREHNVIWTSADGTDHRVSGLQPPEELVAIARSQVCG
ncbi:hypothetical protein GUY44_24030 [Pimelobacter simplex]|uniref:hypothetical protein n=1 Tax=Nocardioides simplex TaxID=2045 RepID=UPI0011411724|nr:hypothetical protein [Pimelobacter simplex]MCG8153569.1 hypothetical protein [Pimelobacter simplex]